MSKIYSYCSRWWRRFIISSVESVREISTVECLGSGMVTMHAVAVRTVQKWPPQKRRNISCIYSLCRDSCLRCFYLAQSAPLSLPLAHFLKNFPDPVVHLSNQMPPRTFPQVLVHLTPTSTCSAVLIFSFPTCCWYTCLSLCHQCFSMYKQLTILLPVCHVVHLRSSCVYQLLFSCFVNFLPDTR